MQGVHTYAGHSHARVCLL